MRSLVTVMLTSSLILTASMVRGQPPVRPEEGSKDKRFDAASVSFIARMMTFDSNQDGKLSKDEVTDARLLNLFTDSDADKDGVVTKEELTTYYNKESVNLRRGGPDGPGGPPPFGELLPPPVRDMLRLSSAQRKKVDALQKQFDVKLEQILTEEQKTQLDEIRRRRPGGPEGDRDRPSPPSDRERGGTPDEPRRPLRAPEKPSE